MNAFDDHVFAPDFDLYAPALVEASAGTGKTYNIQNVYVRLVVQYGVPVQKILVVTFTDAATHELRERLRTVLADCRNELVCLAETHACSKPGERAARLLVLPVYALDTAGKSHAVDAAERLTIQQQRIALALLDFDEAAISTLHGFCQGVLEKYAFECGHDPEAELLFDQGNLLGSLCREWWRRETYEGGDVAFKHPGELQSLVAAYLKRPDARLLPEVDEGGLPVATEPPAAFEAFRVAAAMLAQSLHGKRNMEWDNATDGWTVVVNKARLSVDGASTALAAMRVALTPEMLDFFSDHVMASAEMKEAMRPSLIVEWVRTVFAESSPAGIDLKLLRDELKLLMNPDSITFFRATGGALLGGRMASLTAVQAPAKVTAVLAVAALFRDRVRERLALTFDAMLSNVRDAVKDGEGAEALRRVLCEEYAAALIDEFQDTDPVQYEIFSTLFEEAGVPLFYIGDPKQAIYGFRGGDIHTYYGARRALVARYPERQFGLGTNWRSEEALLSAINGVFADPQDSKTFKHEDINYPGTLAAHKMDMGKRLLIDGEPDKTPFQLWQCQMPDKGDIPGKFSAYARQVYDAVAEEVVALLQNQSITLPPASGGMSRRPVRPGDVAILVMDHGEAQHICNALETRNVHAVRQNVGNVFDTDEAFALLFLLEAMANPSNATAVRTALAGPLLPCSTAQLAGFNATSGAGGETVVSAGGLSLSTMAEWMELFLAAGTTWRERSFIEAVRKVMTQVNMRAHLIAQDDGERRLTNLLHLVELLHTAASVRHTGPVGLLRWLRLQLDAETREESEEQALCLETDDDAVKIMTVFKSKGLEFPIVFVPTLWRRKAQAKRNQDTMLAYHDPQAVDGPLLLDLDADDETKKALAKAECVQENIRLAYVALTRAVHRVYLVCGDRGESDSYALRHLAETRNLSAIPGCCIRERDFSGKNEVGLAVWHPEEAEEFDLKVFDKVGIPNINKSHGHTSFSGLSPQAGYRAPSPRDNDGTDADETEAAASAVETLLTFPAGAKTGDCWHNIFEQADFQNFTPADALVRSELQRGGLLANISDDVAENRVQLTGGMVAAVLEKELHYKTGSSQRSLRLRGLPGGRCIPEFKFDFALKQKGNVMNTQALFRVIEQFWGHDESKRLFVDRLTEWNREIPLGYMTGFIDLLFCYDDRFFIIDWKSNKLHRRASDFKQAGMVAEMAHHAYFLQYLLYTVAVHGYLQNTLADYDYDRHFGGVYYLFLRGVSEGPEHGVFTDRPPRALIDGLARVLTGADERGGAL